jgi:hypothetical protein
MYHEFLPVITQPADLESKRRNRDALLSLVQSFCALLKKVDEAEEFHHKLSGKIGARFQGKRIFARRSVHFLITCMLNTYSWRIPFGLDFHRILSQTRTSVEDVCICGYLSL